MSTATTSTRSAPRRRRKDDTKLALLFIAPATVGLLVFLVWPLLTGLYYSFTEYTTLTPPQWIGLENYQRLIADPIFWKSLKVTVLYVLINIGVQTVVALLIAVLMQRLTQSTILRSLVLTPYLVSNVVAAITFLWILDTQLGIFNIFLTWIGFDPVSFWSSETWVIPTVALVNVWRHMGYTALLLFAGLQSIPHPSLRGGAHRGGRRDHPVPSHHPAAAAPDPGAGADHDDHRLVPGVRHDLRDHPGRSGRRLEGAADVHL